MLLCVVEGEALPLGVELELEVTLCVRLGVDVPDADSL